MINGPRLQVVRDSLKCGALFLLLILGLQLSYLLAQVGSVLRTVEAEAQRTSSQAQNSLLYAQAVLSSARQTTEIVRRSAEHQMGYYEAMGRRSSLALAKLNLLIDRTDARLERVTQALENTSERAMWNADHYGRLAVRLDQTIVGLRDPVLYLTLSANQTLEELRGKIEQLEPGQTNAALVRLLERLITSTETMNRLLEQQVRGKPGPIGWLLWRPGSPKPRE